MAPTDFFGARIPVSPDNAEAFECDFEDHAVRIVQATMEMLLGTENLKRWTRTRECNLGDAEDEDIAKEDGVWAPRYVIKFRNFGEDHEARLIGHVEFLAGRPGALSEAYSLRQTGKWGSLRCVLGEKRSIEAMNNMLTTFRRHRAMDAHEQPPLLLRSQQRRDHVSPDGS